MPIKDLSGSSGGSATCGPVISYSQLIAATSGLRAYWRLEETGGTTVADNLGSAPGEYMNSPTLGVTGIPGGGKGFVAATSGSKYVRIPYVNSLRLLDGPLTLELWVKRTSVNGTQNGLLSGGGEAYYLRINESSRIMFLKSQTAAIATSTTALTDTTNWHHVVATKSGATTKLYLDGGELATTGSNATLINSVHSYAYIGSEINGSEVCDGTIDEVAIYNVALSPAQIAEHYTRGMTAGGVGQTPIEAVPHRSITASAAGLASASASVGRKRALLAAASGQAATTSATVEAVAPIAVVRIPATGMLGTLLSLPGRLLLGSPPAAAAAKLLTATAAGVAIAAGTLHAKRALSAAAAGAATATAVLLRVRGLAGASAGLAATIGTLTARHALSGLSGASATVSATLTRLVPGIGGTSQGRTTAAAVLTVRHVIGGSSAGAAVVNATLTRKRSLTAVSDGRATTTAAPTARRRLLAAAQGVATTSSATLSRKIALVAAAVGQATVSVLLQRARSLVATSAGSSSADVTNLQRLRALEAQAHGAAWTDALVSVPLPRGAAEGERVVAGAARTSLAGALVGKSTSDSWVTLAVGDAVAQSAPHVGAVNPDAATDPPLAGSARGS